MCGGVSFAAKHLTLSKSSSIMKSAMNGGQVEARYPEYKDRMAKTLSPEKCKRILEEKLEIN